MIRINHAEITVPRGFVAQHKEAMDRFFLEVLRFELSAFPGIEESSLVYKTDPEASQFLFIAEHDQPAQRLSDDHLGLHLDSRDEVDAMLQRCIFFAETQPNLEIRRFDPLELTETITYSFYVRFHLPIWFDVQHIAHRPGREPAREWRFVERREQ